MNDINALCNLVQPLLKQFHAHSVLTAGDLAAACVETVKDTRIQQLTTPYSLQQLSDLDSMDAAIISHLTESMSKQQGQQWLGLIKNLYSPHVILITHPELALKNGWEFTDYIALGFSHIAGTAEGLQIFSYAIETYQPKRDWLNSRFWANPELYDKYRW